MKDEEMAEEYRKDLKSKFFLSEPQLDLACQGYKDGFLAGLKAGRPQWYDLRKDPNDLPKENILVLVMLENGKPITSGISTDNRWFCTDYDTGDDKVIAWCEIPTFDKE